MDGESRYPESLDSFADLEPRDHIYYLGIEFDMEAQQCAIAGLLRRHREADRRLTVEIQAIEKHARQLSGVRNVQAIEEWIDRLHASVYQDAAHSMAAVGMLAPLIETIFHQCFQGMRAQFFPAADPRNGHERWTGVGRDKRWDCHFFWKDQQWKRDLSRGVLQLSNAVGLSDRLPNDLEPTLAALIAYRNLMFHQGFEWPLSERTKFEARIANERWPTGWFMKSETGGKPWIFYLSESLVDHCLASIDHVLDAIGGFVLDELSDRTDSS